MRPLFSAAVDFSFLVFIYFDRFYLTPFVMTVTKRDHSTKRTPTMVGPSAVMDRGKSWIETPSRINFDSNVLSVGQRYDYPIGIKDGLRTKKVKPTYNPDAAPVYDPGFEKSDREMLE